MTARRGSGGPSRRRGRRRPSRSWRWPRRDPRSSTSRPASARVPKRMPRRYTPNASTRRAPGSSTASTSGTRGTTRPSAGRCSALAASNRSSFVAGRSAKSTDPEPPQFLIVGTEHDDGRPADAATFVRVPQVERLQYLDAAGIAEDRERQPPAGRQRGVASRRMDRDGNDVSAEHVESPASSSGHSGRVPRRCPGAAAVVEAAGEAPGVRLDLRPAERAVRIGHGRSVGVGDVEQPRWLVIGRHLQLLSNLVISSPTGLRNLVAASYWTIWTAST